MRRVMWNAVVACVGVVVGVQYVPAEMLPATATAWEAKVFPAPEITPEQACPMTVAEGELRIGPWRTGSWSARWQYATPLPPSEGTLTGMYRTESALPFTTEAAVYFLRGGERVGRKRIALAPSSDWRPFRLAVWSLPEGVEAVMPAVGLGAKGDTVAFFKDLSWEKGKPAVEMLQAPAALTRPARPAGLATGKFYRLEQTGAGAWWFVSPDGAATYSAGVDGGWPKTVEAGLQKAAWMREHGLNSLGGWSDVARWGEVNEALAREGKPPMLGFFAMESGTFKDPFDTLQDSSGKPLGGTGAHRFPDPFDPKWRQAYRKHAERRAAAVRGKPWFVAWCADNEVTHTGLYRYVWSEHCGREFVAFLKAWYADIGALNAKWNTKYGSFEELAAAKPDPGELPSAKRADFEAFAPKVMAAYANYELETIRSVDPDHLVFSNRFMVHEAANLAPLLEAYRGYDGIAVNLYPANQSAGLSDNERAALRLIHERTGRPIVITEWSVPALDSRLYDNAKKLDWSYDEALPTQTDRARQAACVAADFYNLPFVVGAHWFTWGDIDNAQRQANRGLFKADQVTEWEELVGALAKVQQMLRK